MKLLFLTVLVSASIGAAPLKVLSYSSLLGKDSLGEFLEQEFPKFCSGCAVQFKSTDEMSGLLGKLRTEKSRKKHTQFDAVLGLDSHHYTLARKEGLINIGRPFDKSPFAFIVDTEKLAQKDWPKSWGELKNKLAGQVFISDPRLSSPGFGWLRSINLEKLQSLGDSKLLVKRVFPSWSGAYSAFTKGESVAVWSYLSSQAYHMCNEKTVAQQNRYRALPLKEGYPEQVEYFAEASFSQHPMAKDFARFLTSPLVQSAIPLKNWMFPVVAGTPLPECFKGLAPVNSLASEPNFSKEDVQIWTDQWAL